MQSGAVFWSHRADTVCQSVSDQVIVCLSVCRCVCNRSDVWTTPGAGRGGPSGSLSSSVGKLGSDDEMSLNDYASLTPGKFTEDGSFIGQYNPAMKWKSSQPPAYQSHA